MDILHENIRLLGNMEYNLICVFTKVFGVNLCKINPFLYTGPLVRNPQKALILDFYGSSFFYVSPQVLDGRDRAHVCQKSWEITEGKKDHVNFVCSYYLNKLPNLIWNRLIIVSHCRNTLSRKTPGLPVFHMSVDCGLLDFSTQDAKAMQTRHMSACFKEKRNRSLSVNRFWQR